MTREQLIKLAEYMQPILGDPTPQGALAILAIFKNSQYMQDKLAKAIYKTQPTTESDLLKIVVQHLKELDQRKLQGLTD